VASEMLAHGEITEDDLTGLLDFAIDEDREDPPWGAWLQRARERVERERGTEAG
jgi:hypothetical protein